MRLRIAVAWTVRIMFVGTAWLAVEGRTAVPGVDDWYPANYVAGSLVQLRDNGAYSWFMDPRVVVDRGKLIVGLILPPDESSHQ
jgi:hypothetical protein